MNPTAEQVSNGVTPAGEEFSVARYGNMLVTVLDGESDDELFATEAAAVREFDDRVAMLKTGDA